MTTSYDQLAQELSYDESTGLFTWRKSTKRGGQRTAGKIAGTLKSNGRIVIGVEGRYYQAHRLAWLFVHKAWPDFHLDHINGDPTDNRISNLRPATVAENQQNLSTRGRGGAGMIGVTWHKQCGKWQAAIKTNGRNIYLGLFKALKAVHSAYVDAKKVYHCFNPTLRDSA